MLSNKDIRVEGRNLIINGEKHPLDPAVNALIKRANIVQGKLTTLDTKLDAIEALEKTASGNPISLTGAAAAYAMGLSMTIEPVQGGSGDPSPTNVRPISGLTEGKVFDYGENLVDITTLTSSRQEQGIAFTLNGDGSVTANGTATGRCQIYWVIPNNSATQFAGKALSGNLSINNCSLILELDGSPFTTYAIDNGEGDVISDDITSAPASNGVSLIWRIQAGVTLDHVTITPRISDAATATITFGQTVYGGSVNFKTGEVTVTHGFITLDGSNDEGWTFTNRFETAIGLVSNVNESSDSHISNMLTCATNNNASRCADTENVFAIYANGKIYLSYNIASSVSDLQAKLSETPLNICYELETPTTFTLTPAELELLKGANTISGNGININIGYIGR